MKISLIAGSALLLSLPVSAQNMLDFRAPKVEAVEKCSVERRHANDPFTWFNSNMCEKDWNTWQAEHPSHPFYKDKYFWMGTTVIGAAVALDAASTSWGQGQKPPFIENNPLLGKHPSNAKLVGFGIAGFGSYEVLHIFSYHESHRDPSKAWREIGRWAIPAIVASIHGHYAAHNYGL